MESRIVARILSGVVLLAALSCRPPSQVPAAPAAPAVLTIPVYEITPRVGDTLGLSLSRNRDPLAALGATKRVSLRSQNADARTLLLWLAQEAGVNLVVSPDVRARVSVNFDDVPAVDAMRAVIAEAQLSVLAPAMQSPWPPVVFHQLPVNINSASAETIAARFGVSPEMAKWIVETRVKP